MRPARCGPCGAGCGSTTSGARPEGLIISHAFLATSKNPAFERFLAARSSFYWTLDMPPSPVRPSDSRQTELAASGSGRRTPSPSSMTIRAPAQYRNARAGEAGLISMI